LSRPWFDFIGFGWTLRTLRFDEPLRGTVQRAVAHMAASHDD